MKAPKPLLLAITLTLSALALGLTLTGSSQATLLPQPAGSSEGTVPRVASGLGWLSEHADASKISADWMGRAWDLQTVDSDGEVGSDTSLVLDSANNPHVSYHDYTNRDLKYARWTGSTWNLQTVDGPGDVGGYTSLALDSADDPQKVVENLSGLQRSQRPQQETACGQHSGDATLEALARVQRREKALGRRRAQGGRRQLHQHERHGAQHDGQVRRP